MRWAWAWVPTRYTPKAAPLAPRAYPPVTDPRAVHWSQLVPGDGANINRPNVSAEGIWNTFGQQAYAAELTFCSVAMATA